MSCKQPSLRIWSSFVLFALGVSSNSCSSSPDQEAAAKCEANAAQAGEGSVCLCPPYEYQGPAELSGDAPSADWALSVGNEGDDFPVVLLALPDDGLLICGRSSLRRIGSNGALQWETTFDLRATDATSLPDGDLLMVFEHVDDDPNLVLGDVELTVQQTLATIVARLDGDTGAFIDAFELPAAEGELWTGFEADDSGFFVFRTSTVGHVIKYGFDGNELWRVEHALGEYEAAKDPRGGVVLAGNDGEALVVQHLDADREETWTYTPPTTAGYVNPMVKVRTIDVSPEGRVAVGLTLSDVDPEPSGPPQRFFIVTFAPDGTLLEALPSEVRPAGAASLPDGGVLVWRVAEPGEAPGWYLTKLAAGGSEAWRWMLPARSDYWLFQSNLPRGAMAFRDGYVYAAGAFVGGLQVGGTRVDSAGCTDHFVVRFGLQ